MQRVLVLPSHGRLLVSTDLHGNRQDLQRLTEVFEGMRAESEDAHWVLLGDLVHGPDLESSLTAPHLYGYADESKAMVQDLADLVSRYPEQVHFVLGNHDYGHLGGPHPSKFHPDEVQHLESQMTDDERRDMKELFRSSLLVVAAPCGLLLTHGSPGAEILDLECVDKIDVASPTAEELAVLRSLLVYYGQVESVTDALLKRCSRGDLLLKVVVHGHDRDESGYFYEWGNQLCLCIFGALRENKRYLDVDLSVPVTSVFELRDGEGIRRLYSV